MKSSSQGLGMSKQGSVMSRRSDSVRSSAAHRTAKVKLESRKEGLTEADLNIFDENYKSLIGLKIEKE